MVRRKSTNVSVDGLVTREADPSDKRMMKLHLTQAAGDALLLLSLTHRDELRTLRPLLNELLAKLN